MYKLSVSEFPVEGFTGYFVFGPIEHSETRRKKKYSCVCCV